MLHLTDIDICSDWFGNSLVSYDFTYSGCLEFVFLNNFNFFLLSFHYCTNFLRKQEDTAINKKLQEEESCSIFDITLLLMIHFRYNHLFPIILTLWSNFFLFCECTAWVYIFQM